MRAARLAQAAQTIRQLELVARQQEAGHCVSLQSCARTITTQTTSWVLEGRLVAPPARHGD